MKLSDKKKVKNPKLKKKPIIKPKKEKILVVAQEFKFARLLSGNEKKTRDRVLKTLKKWLLNCFEKGYEFKEDDFIRVWKGLFYAVWMSDKPLVQEELCENISEILDLFPVEQIEYAIMMIKAGFRVLATEWYGLDQHRMDKFLMLVRRLLRGGWRCLERSAWGLDSCDRFADMMMGPDGLLAVKPPSFARNALSLMLHITDCYLEELSKVAQGSIPGPALAALLRPFTRLVCSDSALAVPARRLLTALIEQSDLGLDYQDKTRAWQRMGCPVGGPEALELEEDEEEDAEEQTQHSEEEDQDRGAPPLDPRAGRVSVFLRALPVPAALLAAQLRGLTSAGSPASPGSRTSYAAGRRARLCADRFEALSCSQYPLPLRDCDRPTPAPPAPSLARAARGLCALERALGESTDVLALKDLSRKRRKKLLAKTRAGLSIEEEVAPDSTIGEWQVEETETNRKDSDKENFKKKKDRKRKTKNVEAALDNKKSKINENGIKAETKTHTNKIKKKPINNEEKQSKVEVISNKEKINKNTENEANKVYKLRNGGVDKNNKKNNNNVVSGESDKPTKNINQEIINQNGVQKTNKPIATKAKKYQKQTSQVKNDSPKKRVTLETPKKVKFVLKNNSMQGALDYYQSVRRSPSIPYDGNKLPSKTNLKVSTPSPINPFFKKKFKLKMNL